jgi:hypothetical protein
MMTDTDDLDRFARRAREGGIAERLLDFAGRIPESRTRQRVDALKRSRALARRASVKTAATSGALALPPGPLGWLTIAPELLTVWKMQRQLVADIAGLYGRDKELGREQMLYCLFGHTAAGAFSDVVLRVGERWVVRRTPLTTLYAIANKIALRIAQRGASRVVTRWLPVAGAVGVAGFVYLDTGKVADAAIALFGGDVVIEGEAETVPAPSSTKRAPRRRPAAVRTA